MKNTMVAIALAMTSMTAFADTAALDKEYAELMSNLPVIEAYADVVADCKIQVSVRGVADGLKQEACRQTSSSLDTLLEIMEKAQSTSLKIAAKPEYAKTKPAADIRKVVRMGAKVNKLASNLSYITSRMKMATKK